MIAPEASPGETKMWAAVRENGDFFAFVDHVKTNKHMFEFFSPSGSHTILVYRSYTDTKHRAAALRQQSFLYLNNYCELKQHFLHVWHGTDNAIDEWHGRLHARVRAKGGHFEQLR